MHASDYNIDVDGLSTGLAIIVGNYIRNGVFFLRGKRID